MLVMSREPSSDHKIQFPSIAELKDGFVTLTNRIGRRLKFRGRKLRNGPLLNAIVLHYMLLPEQEQLEIAERYLRKYEALLAFDEPQDDLGSIVADDGDPTRERVVGLGATVRKVRPKPKG